jgi:hypothetical protein
MQIVSIGNENNLSGPKKRPQFIYFITNSFRLAKIRLTSWLQLVSVKARPQRQVTA